MPKARFTTISLRTRNLPVEKLSTNIHLEDIAQHAYEELVSKKLKRVEFLTTPYGNKFMKAMFTLIWLLNNDRFVGHWDKPEIDGKEDTNRSHWSWSADAFLYGWVKYVALINPFKQVIFPDDKRFLRAYSCVVSDEKKKKYKEDLTHQLTFDYRQVELKPSQYTILMTDQYGRYNRSRVSQNEQFIFNGVDILGTLIEMGVLSQEEIDNINHINKHTELYSPLHILREDVDKFLEKINFDIRLYRDLVNSINEYKYKTLLFKRLETIVKNFDTLRDPKVLGKTSFKGKFAKGGVYKYNFNFCKDMGNTIKEFYCLRGGTYKQLQQFITDIAGVSSKQIQYYVKRCGYTKKKVPKDFYDDMFERAKRKCGGVVQKPPLFRYSFAKLGEKGNTIVVESCSRNAFLKKMHWLQRHDYFPRSLLINKNHNYERLQEAQEEKVSTKAVCQHFNTLLQNPQWGPCDDYANVQAFKNLKRNTCRPTTGIATTHKRSNDKDEIQNVDESKETNLKHSAEKEVVLGSPEDVYAWQNSSRETVLHERNLCSVPVGFFDLEKDGLKAEDIIKAYQYKNNKVLQEVDVHNSIFKILSANKNKRFQSVEKDLVDNFIKKLFSYEWKDLTAERKEELLEEEKKKRGQYKLLLTSWAFSSLRQIRYFIQNIQDSVDIIIINRKNFSFVNWGPLSEQLHQLEGYDRYQFLLYLYCKLDMHATHPMNGKTRASEFHLADKCANYADSDTGDKVCLSCFYRFISRLRQLYLQWMYSRIGSSKMTRKVFLYETQVETTAACMCEDPDLCILYDAVLTNKPEYFKKCLDSSYAMLRCNIMKDFLFLMTRCLQLKKGASCRQKIIHAYLDPYMKLLDKINVLNSWNRKKLDNEYLLQVKDLKDKFCKELSLGLTAEEEELSKTYYWLRTKDCNRIKDAEANIYYLPLTTQENLYGKDAVSQWIGKNW